MNKFNKWLQVKESIGHDGMIKIYNDMKPKIEPKLRVLIEKFLSEYAKNSMPISTGDDFHVVTPENITNAMVQILQDLSLELSNKRGKATAQDDDNWVRLP